MRHDGCIRICHLRRDNPRNLLHSNAFHPKLLPRQHCRGTVCKVTGRGDWRSGSAHCKTAGQRHIESSEKARVQDSVQIHTVLLRAESSNAPSVRASRT